MRKIITTAGIIVLTVTALAGCGIRSGAQAGVSSHASVAATNTSAAYAKTQAKQVLDKCMPAQNALTQLEWLRNIASKSKGHQARQTFENCAGVSKANDAKFQNQVENDGLAALKVYAHDESAGNKVAAKAAVRNYAENTVEKDAVANR